MPRPEIKDTTPAAIFEIAKYDQSFNLALHLWEQGAIDWEYMLIRLIKVTEKRCQDLSDHYNLTEVIRSAVMPLGSMPLAVLESSIAPNFRGIEDPLQRQQLLIERCVIAYQIYNSIVELAMLKGGTITKLTIPKSAGAGLRWEGFFRGD